MIKAKRNLIIVIAVIALLVIGTFVLTRVDTEKKETVTEQTGSYSVYSEKASDLASVKVRTEDFEIEAVNNGKSEWTIDGFSAEEIDKGKAYSLAGTISTITSKNKYDIPADLSEYGLDNPSVTVTITKKNGEVDTLYIGDLSPVLNEYFIMLDGDENVYTLYSYKVEALLKPVSYYRQFDRFNVNVEDITDIKMERASDTVEIKIRDVIDMNTNNVWEMVSPYQSGANDDYIDNKILAPIEEIALTEPVEADGGFTDSSPIVTITVTPFDNSNGKYGEPYTETLVIGKTEGNITYVKYNDEVYTTPASSVSFVNEAAFNIVSKMQALVDISLVKNVTVEYGNESHVIEVKSEAANKYSFTLDGKETEAKISQEMYRNIIALAVDGLYNGEALNDTLLKITYTGINGADDTVIEIKRIDDMNCAMLKNGTAEFTLKKSKVDEFLTLFEAYVNNI